jgi:peptide/nickel transport system permease protein
LAAEYATKLNDERVANAASGALFSAETTRSGSGHRVRRELVRNRFALVGTVFLFAIILVGVFAPAIAPHSPTDQRILERLKGPTSTHWLGTDELGRDELSRLIYGARTSLFIGFAGTAGGVMVGLIVGLMSGFFGSWIDTLAMRVIDIMYAFPGILLAILIVAVMGPGLFNLVVALTLWGVPTLSRIVRSSVLSLKAEQFVEASRAIGASRTRIMFRHLLPNCLAPIIVYATLGVAGALLTTAGLGFLGIGVQPPSAEWGEMLSVGRDYLREAPLLLLVPGVAIFLAVMSLNLIGDALRDALDPRIKS